MQIFNLISVAVPLLIASGIPVWLKNSGFSGEYRYRSLLYIACILFFISWYLPSPLIDGEDTSFTTHFVGGGIFCGLLWIYLKYSMNWRSKWWIEASSLFALVSALGCVNELAEIFMVKTGMASITLTDTSWDILANTLGSASVWLVYLFLNRVSSR